MNRFAVVTDSTSNLSPDLTEEMGIPVIPLNVHWGDESYLDGVTLEAAAFYELLKSREEFPKTSQPSSRTFIDFFVKAAETHQTKTVLGVFISAEMSGTVASALQAKAELAVARPDLRVEVLDSRSVSMGLGLQVLVAQRALRAGLNVDDAVGEILRCRDDVQVIFAVDTLEYLYRGGRIGGAARLLGSALQLKPVLGIEAGKVQPLEKVRSRRKSLRRVVELAEMHLAGRRPAELGVMSADADDDLGWFTEMVVERLHPQRLHSGVLSPVVGTHGGPGTIGIAFYAGQAAEA
jgi:DegV family protein with EDD domain